MTVVHFPYTYFPDAAGGTEIYVDALCRHLRDDGIDARVAAPAKNSRENGGSKGKDYQHHGVPVRRFKTSRVTDPSDVYGAGDSMGAERAGRILDDWTPDLVHLHAHTRAVSLRLAEEAAARDIPIIFTYHTPTVSCLRGTLLEKGTAVCDGELDVERCAACMLQNHGLRGRAADLLSHVPSTVGSLAGRAGLKGGAWTALRMTDLVRQHHDATLDLFATVDHVVAVCEWVRDLIERNGVSPSKITVSRQGLSQRHGPSAEADASTALPDRFDSTRPLRLLFLGRVHPIKGIHVVLDALKQIPDAPITLDVYGVVQNQGDYARDVRTQCESDPRVQWREPIPSETVPERIGQYDALVVPSQGRETGPLVVYEAFAAGRPVVGSDLGGIAEIVSSEVDGLLVAPEDDAREWARALQRLIADPSFVAALREGVQAPRSMEAVGKEMIQCYRSLLH